MKRRTIHAAFIVAAIVLSSPAMAAVYIDCIDLGNGVIELSYDSSEEEMQVRAFSLDIRVSSGIITSVGDFSRHYYVYPCTIEIDADGEVLDWGTPVASSSYPGTLGGLGTSGMTIEMGSLYLGEANAPPRVGVLLTFTISAACDITVAQNVIRGGVVMEDPDYHPPVYMSGLEGALPPEPEEYGGGSGTAADPFLILDTNQMNTIGARAGDWYKHFRLMADIDLGGYTGTDFNLVGKYLSSGFRGVFDGNKHKIFNFTYSSTDSNSTGLFGRVDAANAEIKDLDLINPDVNAPSADKVGSLAGFIRKGTISRCSAQGGMVSGHNCVGGLVGRNYLGTIVDCYASTQVVGDASLGGLVGRTYADISDCYSVGSVTTDANLVGAFAAYNKGNISSAFWDEQTSGQIDGVGATGGSATTDLTGELTTQMQAKSTFTDAGWDFKGESANGTDDIWTICEGQTYPRLVRTRFKADLIGSEGVNLPDFAFLAHCWMKDTCECLPADITGNGLVDEKDLQEMAENWLAGL